MVTGKLKLKKGDTVQLRRGRDRGKMGKVLSVLRDSGRVLVENTNLIKKHVRPKRQGEKGSRIDVAASVPIANVMVVCPSCKKATRIGMKQADGQTTRVCKRCQAAV